MDSELTLTRLPAPETLYAALVARDPSWEGRALVGVTSTGIFCRLTCPARKPRPEHCRWFDSPAAALAAGFRPCRRCHPLGPEAEGDATVQRLLAALEAEPARRWSEADIAALGLDPSTVRRAFRRHFVAADVPAAAQTRLREAVLKVLEQPAVRQRFAALGLDMAPPASQDELVRSLRTASERQAATLKAVGFKPE